MISFRYHLISIVAIFLALALGVVVGTTAVNGAVVSDLRHQVKDLKSAKSADNTTIASLQGSAGNANALAQAYGTQIAANKLANTSVVILGAPGASSSLLGGVASAVVTAGGKVSAQLQLGAAFTDPTRANDVISLTTTVHPLGLILPPGTADAGTLAGALLGWVLLGHGNPTDLAAVVAGFNGLGMLTATGTPSPGKVLVLVGPGSKPAEDPGIRMLSTLSTEIAVSGNAVVVAGDGPSATGGGLVAVLRASTAAKGALSTVDDADTALGQLTTALAAAQAIAGRKAQFGTAASAEALLPGTGS